jgi:hypothetical protein
MRAPPSEPVSRISVFVVRRLRAARRASARAEVLSAVAAACLSASTACWAATALAQAATAPGEVQTPHPTFEHLSVEWPYTGDDDRDGVVRVRYREVGGTYREALPLRNVAGGTLEGFSWTRKHSGSVFGLRPDTEYEIELSLTDPDGGSTTRVVRARTRRIPVAPPDARRRDATPSTLTATLRDSRPGDLIVLAPGTYTSFTLPNDGTADRPIVVRGADRGAVVVMGEVRFDGRSFVHVEDLTVRGQIKFNGATGVVVRGCDVRTERDGIVALGRGAVDSYIVDNDVEGATRWEEAALGVDGANVGEGIVITGAGTVIQRNRVRGFRDAISLLEDAAAIDQRSIDILDNDVYVGADDGIEADFAMGNVRVMRNRITSSFIGISSQPSLGGPTYFIRNVMFNVAYIPFKLYRGSRGDVVLHNTVVKCGDALAIYAGRTWSDAWFRNNLFIGGSGGGSYGGYANGDGAVAVLADADASCDLDFDGFGSIGTGTFRGRIGATRFASLAELRATTTERNAVQVDLGVFATPPPFPSSGPFPERAPADLRLAAGGAAVDRGTPLPNVNDGFAGAAPDLGAYEAGAGAPSYGPLRGPPPIAMDGGVPTDDAGSPASDGGTTDAGSPSDAGGDDAAAPADGGDDGGARDGAVEDAAGSDGAASVDGSAAPPAVDAGGCGCRVATVSGARGGARTPRTPPLGAWLVAIGAAVGAVRRRARRAPR